MLPLLESEEDEDASGPLYMNVYCTEYDVIKKVARKVLGYKLREYPEDHDGAIRKGEHNQKLVKEWDVTWHDLSITPDFLAKLNPYQKVNHYPGMYAITRKNHLARNLMRMKRAFQEEFNFFPATWVLPGDNIDFMNQFNKPTDDKKQKRQTYIVKPDGLSQGKGIFLTNDLSEIPKDETYVVQQYMQNPYLIDGLKFDLRLYVLVLSCEPLKIFLYQEGMVRFATHQYKPIEQNADKSTMNNLYMHLTNYAVNKENENFKMAKSMNDDTGHKRTLKKVLERLKADGLDPDKIMGETKDVIVKTLITIQQELAHNYRTCQPSDLENLMCFEILGFDIILDDKGKPKLLEVN